MEKLHCDKHPTYKGIHQPRSSCTTCWLMFLSHCVNSAQKRIDKLEAAQRSFALQVSIKE